MQREAGLSGTGTAPRFESWVGQPSNLDRCERCHAPRSAHGADWSCPAPPARQTALLPLAVGINVVLAAIIARLVLGSAATATDAVVLADAFLAGVILSIAGAVGLRKEH